MDQLASTDIEQLAPLDHLRRAVALAGGQTDLVRKVRKALQELESKERISQPKLWNWLNKQDRVPAEFCPAIEIAVGGQVLRQQLRPDVDPEQYQAETAAE